MLFIREILIYAVDKLIDVSTVNGACLLDRFASRRRAAETVHSHVKEILCRTFVKLEYISDQRVFCNLFQSVHLLKKENGI